MTVYHLQFVHNLRERGRGGERGREGERGGREGGREGARRREGGRREGGRCTSCEEGDNIKVGNKKAVP